MANPDNLGKFKHYNMIRRLGDGSTGEVFLAEDTDLSIQVAIKFLRLAPHPDNAVLIKRFQKEAEILAFLDHENIVRIHNAGVKDDVNYIVMEYIEGENLQRLMQTKQFTLLETLKIMKEVLQGLGAVHAEGILHRDIKPANIIVGDKGCVKLVDFGISKRLEFDDDLTRPNHVVGTRTYMAPEVLRGHSPSPASDIFSVAIVFYEMLMGKNPLEKENDAANEKDHENRYSVLRGEPMPLPLASLFQRMMMTDPDRRYSDTISVLAALKRVHGIISAPLNPEPGKKAREPIQSKKEKVPPKRIPKPLKVPVKKIALSLFALVLASFLAWKKEEAKSYAMKMLNKSTWEEMRSELLEVRGLSDKLPGLRQIASFDQGIELAPVEKGASFHFIEKDIAEKSGRTIRTESRSMVIVRVVDGRVVARLKSDKSEKEGLMEMSVNNLIPPFIDERPGGGTVKNKVTGQYNEIFPLAIGKKMTYSSIQLSSTGRFEQSVQNCEVLATENISVGSETLLTYVVNCEGTKDGWPHVTLSYYSPELNFVVRREMRLREAGQALVRTEQMTSFEIPATAPY